jgi:prepilin-type N-terminal cleavage/methylation domain-containing protein
LKRSSFHFSPPRRGFTLIELLLAIAIAAIALTIVNATFFQSHRTIESVRQQRETYQMVRIVMDRIIKDISCCYVPSADRDMSDDDISMYRFVGEDDSDNEGDRDSIYFTTTADLGLPSLSGGICEAGYYLKEMEEDQGRYYLIRREDCTFHTGVSDIPREMELAEDVLGMNIVYIDKDNQEVDEWDLQDKLSLPNQIRITITLAGREDPFEVTGLAFLPLSSIQLKKVQGEQP